MRLAVIAAVLCAACFSVSSQDQFLMGAQLQAEIDKSCAEGCITFNRTEAQTFMDRLQMILMQKQACASLI